MVEVRSLKFELLFLEAIFHLTSDSTAGGVDLLGGNLSVSRGGNDKSRVEATRSETTLARPLAGIYATSPESCIGERTELQAAGELFKQGLFPELRGSCVINRALLINKT